MGRHPSDPVGVYLRRQDDVVIVLGSRRRAAFHTGSLRLLLADIRIVRPLRLSLFLRRNLLVVFLGVCHGVDAHPGHEPRRTTARRRQRIATRYRP